MRPTRLFTSFGLALALSIAAVFAPGARAEAGGPFVLGISAEGGGVVTDPQSALGGVALRIGFRVPVLTIYLQSHALVGALTGGPRSGTAQGLLWNTAMLGVELGPVHLAVGPSLDLAWGCDTQQGCVDGSPLFGLDARLALHLDSLVLSGDVHPTFVDDDVAVGVIFGVGWQL